MPLKGGYTWYEKSDHLKIQVPLKGVSPKTVDIFVTAESLKVNYSPFIIDILLSGRVDPTKQKAVFRDGTLIITLMKEMKRTIRRVKRKYGILCMSILVFAPFTTLI